MHPCASSIFSAIPGCRFGPKRNFFVASSFSLSVSIDSNNCPHESMSLPPGSSCSDLCGVDCGGCVMVALKSLTQARKLQGVDDGKGIATVVLEPLQRLGGLGAVFCCCRLMGLRQFLILFSVVATFFQSLLALCDTASPNPSPSSHRVHGLLLEDNRR